MRRVKADLLVQGLLDSPGPGLLKELPHAPGVYFLKGRGRADAVEYVRRCADLGSSIPTEFISRLESQSAQADLAQRSRPAAVGAFDSLSELDYVVTDSVIEAELLELDLIRRYRLEPNIHREGPREALFLHIDNAQPFPVFEVSRRFPEPEMIGFGPFFEPDKLRRGLEVARRILRLRYCGGVFPPPGHERCVRHQKSHCAAPCRGTITPAVYRSRLERLVLFLRGEDDRLLGDLRGAYRAMSPGEIGAFDEGARDLLSIQRGLLDLSEPSKGAKLLVTSPGGANGRATVVLFRRGRIIDRFRTFPGHARIERLVQRMQSALLVHRADPVGLLRPEELAASQVVKRHIASPEPGERIYRVANLSELPKLVELAIRDCHRAPVQVH